ncbi:MAG TPA: SDR family oxidoreductase [Polyangia bacterium]|jgi:hypothetical protein|nr:SDR family oxidoreductase [Polyangia bacterium]
MDLKGQTALITGASSGIGQAFARLLAARGADLIIAARRTDRLEALAAELETQHRVTVTPLPLDLSHPEAPAELHARTEGAGRRIDILINNAGFGTHQPFVDLAWERVREELQLNVIALTELTHRFTRTMKPRGRGHVLNVASVGAFLPVPYYATYAAGKAYVLHFSEALAAELAPSGVRVCCLSPGGTETEFFQVAGQKPSLMARATMMTPDRCARIGLRALFGGRRSIVSGLLNSCMMALLRLIPRRLMPLIAMIAIGRPART